MLKHSFPAKQGTAHATVKCRSTNKNSTCVYTPNHRQVTGVISLENRQLNQEFEHIHLQKELSLHSKVVFMRIHCQFGYEAAREPELLKFTAPRQLCYADLLKTNPSNTLGSATASAELP